eukprot:Nitzschia sp. Nitz4//scaffold85_size83877//37533//38609//NITZ4_005227-RA/size83877-processed-gene-0.120-mRNA-1//1//CDS//3329559131//9475//frame0
MAQRIVGPRAIDTFSLVMAAGYVLSGCCQPLLVQLLRDAGLADAEAQLYMLFYYLGPALVVIPMLQRQAYPKSSRMIWSAVGIALFDTVAASLNYAGASMAGPTIFAVVYSSVTVWTAVFSKLVLGRTLTLRHWLSIALVFGGLTLTATDSMRLGDSVWKGCLLVLVGSAAHAMTYILCEAVMTIGEDKLTVEQNCGIQATVAVIALTFWQLVYTVPHWSDAVADPVTTAGTGLWFALILLILFAFCNWVHTITFYETLLYFPGGATTAGVLKGLQAVLVFVATDWAFCGRTGGEELCITKAKVASLVTVVGGVIAYGMATQYQDNIIEDSNNPSKPGRGRDGYDSISTQSYDIEAIK